MRETDRSAMRGATSGRRNRLLVLSLVALLLILLVVPIAQAAGLPPGGTFTDDNGNVHEGNIEAIAAEGITKGCNPPTNDLYCPSSAVTRGQMAAFLVRALDLPAAATDFFIDDEDSIFEDDINRLAQSGITKGCNPPANEHFCPDSKVTREQMAAFLARALELSDDSGGDLFIDDDSSIFETDIDKLGTAGITKGCNPPANTKYCPKDLVLRDQMASFLARALGLDPIDAPPSNHTWTLPAFDGSVLPGGATAKALGPERLEYVDLCQGGDCETDIRLSVDGIPLYMEVDWIYLPSNGGPVVLSYFLNPDHLAVGPEFMWALERGSADGKIYLSDSLHFSVPDDEELLSVCWSDSYGGPVVAIVTGVTAPVSIDRAWVFKWQPSSSWPGLEGTWLGLDEALIDPQTVLVPPFPGNALPACGI